MRDALRTASAELRTRSEALRTHTNKLRELNDEVRLAASLPRRIAHGAHGMPAAVAEALRRCACAEALVTSQGKDARAATRGLGCSTEAELDAQVRPFRAFAAPRRPYRRSCR